MIPPDGRETTTEDRPMTDAIAWARLVPEMLVADLGRSLAFWRDLIGFTVLFDRAEEGFAYLDLAGAQVMLEERSEVRRNWVTGTLEPPFGRGINLQIEVPATEPIVDRLAAARWPLFLPPEEKWYRTGAVESGQRQFLVQDPDGYLLRLAEVLGERPVAP
jgi:catechol 2,3-dioxygenase-like lactoylglutathione lyase family enzyme